MIIILNVLSLICPRFVFSFISIIAHWYTPTPWGWERSGAWNKDIRKQLPTQSYREFYTHIVERGM